MPIENIHNTEPPEEKSLDKRVFELECQVSMLEDLVTQLINQLNDKGIKVSDKLIYIEEDPFSSPPPPGSITAQDFSQLEIEVLREYSLEQLTNHLASLPEPTIEPVFIEDPYFTQEQFEALAEVGKKKKQKEKE